MMKKTSKMAAAGVLTAMMALSLALRRQLEFRRSGSGRDPGGRLRKDRGENHEGVKPRGARR